MDPSTTLDIAIGAFIDGDYGVAIDALVAYHNWRDRGGFEPTVSYESGPTAGDTVADSLWARMNGFDK